MKCFFLFLTTDYFFKRIYLFFKKVNDAYELCKIVFSTLQFNHEFNINRICGAHCPLECDDVE